MIRGVLRSQYEAICGEVSDRQWDRIRRWLEFSLRDEEHAEEDLNYRAESHPVPTLYIVRDYAVLRSQPWNVKARLRLQDVLDYQRLMAEFPKDCTMSGADIYQGIQKVLVPRPAKQTIYYWGREIGCPMVKGKYYDSKEVQKWLAKVICAGPKFQLRYRFQGVDRLAA